MWRHAYYSTSLHWEHKKLLGYRSFRAVQQFWCQTVFRALGMKESLMVLTTGDWSGFVCQCFSINDDYLARSLMTFVYTELSGSRNLHTITENNTSTVVTVSKDLKGSKHNTLKALGFCYHPIGNKHALSITVWEFFPPQLKLTWSGGTSVLVYLLWPVKALPKILVPDSEGTINLQMRILPTKLS